MRLQGILCLGALFCLWGSIFLVVEKSSELRQRDLEAYRFTLIQERVAVLVNDQNQKQSFNALFNNNKEVHGEEADSAKASRPFWLLDWKIDEDKGTLKPHLLEGAFPRAELLTELQALMEKQRALQGSQKIQVGDHQIIFVAFKKHQTGYLMLGQNVHSMEAPSVLRQEALKVAGLGGFLWVIFVLGLFRFRAKIA